MPQEVFRQGNFTNGELDPAMIGRRDLKPYFNSLLGALNLVPSPQGPINRRPGFAYCGRLRNPMTAIALTGATAAAPNGGTVTNLFTDALPGPVSTTGMSTTNPYVFLLIDLGAPTRVSAVDVTNVAVIAGGGDAGGGGYTPTPPILAPYFPSGGFNLEIP